MVINVFPFIGEVFCNPAGLNFFLKKAGVKWFSRYLFDSAEESLMQKHPWQLLFQREAHSSE